jgi:hypothetical protein
MKQILDNKGIETLEWIVLAAALVVVVYLAYKYLGAQIAEAVRGLATMF